MKKTIFLILIFLALPLHSQVGFGTTTPNAALDISSSNDGFLMPRVELTGKNDCHILTPTVSELVYNTATAGYAPYDVKPGFYYWNGTLWTELVNSSDNYWKATGNTCATAPTSFIGTTDDVDLNFKRKNEPAGNLGKENTSFGVNTLVLNSAVGNTALGVNALSSNTTATGNCAAGYGALQSNAGADNINNTAFGFEALLSNNSATAALAKNNSAIGARALRANTTGYNNTAVGLNSLTSNTSGMFNSAMGVEAMAANISGESNAALGAEALKQNITGSFNTAVGRKSMELNTTGYHNTATGNNSMSRNTTGNRNVAVGYNAMLNNTTGSQNTAIGYSALKNAINSENTAIGFEAMANVTTGSANVAIGNQALTHLTTGSNNIGIGTGVQLPNNAGSNQVRIGNAAITYAGIQVPWTITSDRRWKSDIKSLDLGLDFIKELHPVSYLRKNDESNKLEYGFIAQELEQTLNKFGVTNTGMISKADDGMLSIRYNDLLAPMVKAIQEQQVLIEELTKRMEELEKSEK